MNRVRLPANLLVSALAALTTWLTMTTWGGFSEAPGDYLVPLALGCALVAVTGAVLRAWRLHAVLVVVGQLVLVTLWINHSYGGDASILGIVPTPESIEAVVDRLRASMDAAQSYAAPVPASVDAFPPMLVVIGTYCAVGVDLLAVGLRMVPVAGLPLLALYTAAVSLLDGTISWWRFALVAICFLGLLTAQEANRLAHWGRELGSATAGHARDWGASPRSVWPSARKIGFTATAMAVVLPVFIPTFTGGLFQGSGPGGGPGDGDIRISNPMLNLKRDLERQEDVPLLLVSTDDPQPGYLRVAVLDQFDGKAWKPGRRQIGVEQRVDGELPAPVGLDGSAVSTVERRYRISVDETFRSGWLPAPYPYVQVNAPGDWRYDASTMDIASATEGRTTRGIDYSLTALEVRPTARQLRSAGAIPSDIFDRYTDVDDAVPEEVADLAAAVTARGTNRAERAALLQQWFTQPHDDERADPSFAYDISRADDGSSIEALVDFLMHSRTGYCEQFAGAMALMARTLLIPARVAVGFLRPERVGQEGTWIYSSHDLHAWPELYFEGVGWVIFEPTPSSRQGATSPSYTLGLQPTVEDDDPRPLPLPTAEGPATAQPQLPDRLEEEQPTGGASATTGSGRTWLAVGAGVLPLLIALLALPRTLRTLIRRRRWNGARTAQEQAEAAWAELRDAMVDLGLPWDDRVTLRRRVEDIVPLLCRHPGAGEEHLAQVIRGNPEAESALERILLLVERARYARWAPEAGDVRGDVRTVVEALRVGVDPQARRRADWLPRSVFEATLRPAKGNAGIALSEPSVGR